MEFCKANEWGIGQDMYKVVIIDDEPIIVKGLEKTIKWEELGCVVVGTAYNGVEGLDLIQTKRPDILISDICMPGMDGLTMIAARKSEFPNMEITILTGFRDFDYAQQAIRLGVCRFLLKPSIMDELNEAIKVMVERLDRKKLLYKEDVAQTEKEEEKEETENVAGSFIVKNALAFMEENYAERLKLVDVADKVYVSQWHLSKLLNKYTGQNFSELLNHVRMKKAKELLGDPSLRISDIAEEVGFLDMAHFSRVFKKLAGVSANEYRNTISVPQKTKQ